MQYLAAHLIGLPSTLSAGAGPVGQMHRSHRPIFFHFDSVFIFHLPLEIPSLGPFLPRHSRFTLLMVTFSVCSRLIPHDDIQPFTRNGLLPPPAVLDFDALSFLASSGVTPRGH